MLTRTINMTIFIRLHIRPRGYSKKTSVIEKNPHNIYPIVTQFT